MSVPAVNIVIEKGTDFEATYNVTNPDNSSRSPTNGAAGGGGGSGTVANGGPGGNGFIRIWEYS